MPRGKIGGYHGNVGQVLSEGNVYNFHINNVEGGISNGKEIDFELDGNGNVKIILLILFNLSPLLHLTIE